MKCRQNNLPRPTPIRLLSLLMISLILLPGCTISQPPLTEKDFQEKAQRDKNTIFLQQEALAKSVSLYDAMARAVKYNLDHKVKLLENALAKGILAESQSDLLPKLVASAGYTSRSEENASYSRNLSSGLTTSKQDLSTSEEKDIFTSDLVMAWNVLDFGVGYTRAQQLADEVNIAEEYRRKAVQNISQEVRYAFWRAASADRLLPEMDALVEQVESALKRSRTMEQVLADKPVKVLEYQQELLETMRNLWTMRRSLSTAKTELATLMNLEPGLELTLKVSMKQSFPYPEFDSRSLEQYALVQRPELRTESYQERIGSMEVRKAMLRMLPGLEFNLGTNYDSNDYLYNNSWVQAGFNLTWNTMKLLSGPLAIKKAKMQEELARQRHMATAMMVITQVNLANQHYHLALKEHKISSRLYEVHRRKLKHLDAAKMARASSELDEIRNKTKALAAKMQLGLAFADLQGAIANIYNSIGSDPLPQLIQDDNVQSLAQAMQLHDKNLMSSLSVKRDAHMIINPFADFSEENLITKPAFFPAPQASQVPPWGHEAALPETAGLEFVQGPAGSTAASSATPLSLRVPAVDASRVLAEAGAGYSGLSAPSWQEGDDLISLSDLDDSSPAQLRTLAAQLDHRSAGSGYAPVITFQGKIYDIITATNGKTYLKPRGGMR